MDSKIVIALFADILYAKSIINLDELNGLYDIANVQDVAAYSEKMLRGEFNAYLKGEHYTASKARE